MGDIHLIPWDSYKRNNARVGKDPYVIRKRALLVFHCAVPMLYRHWHGAEGAGSHTGTFKEEDQETMTRCYTFGQTFLLKLPIASRDETASSMVSAREAPSVRKHRNLIHFKVRAKILKIGNSLIAKYSTE